MRTIKRWHQSCGNDLSFAALEQLEPRRLLAATLPAGFKETQFATGFEEVTSMDFAPDGRLFVTELDGRVRVVKNGSTLSTPFLSLKVDRYNNRGLIGLTFDPNFATNRYVYVFYSRPDLSNPNVVDNSTKNRVSRFRASGTNGDVVEAGSEVVLLDNIPNDRGGHNGGALHFGPDGMLYVTTGEAGVTSYSQNLNSLGGKILRLNVKNYPNSIIPSDNPFRGQTGKRGEIWAYGLRHPYTAAIHPVTGRMYANEVGGDLWDEVNEIQKGKNYGWPAVEGPSTNPAYTNGAYSYYHKGIDSAVVGGTFYTGNTFPTKYKDQYFFADFDQDWVKVLNPVTKSVTNFATGLRAPIDLDVGPDGALYYLAYNDRYSTAADRSVYKFQYVGDGNRAPTAEYTVNPTSGIAPMNVDFDASGSSDPDGDALTFRWDFGDGTSSTAMVVQHTYADPGQYIPKLTVTDSKGLADTKTLPTIDASNAVPTGTITSPANGTLYRAGDVISFSGAGTDPEDGTLAAARFAWSVRLVHNNHEHPFLNFNGVTSGSFVIPNPPDEVEANQSYRIKLTVTDSKGAADSSFVDVTPRTSVVTLNTNVPGLNLELDGRVVPAGHTFTGVENAIRTLNAPAAQTVGGKWYEFRSWSDGGAAQHDFNTPADDAAFTATYVEVPAPAVTALRAVADAYVRNGTYATANYGVATELAAKRSSTTGNTRETYLRFDLSSVASIDSARLRLFGRLADARNPSVTTTVYNASNTTWGESSITWNNKPVSGTTSRGSITVAGTTDNWYELDLTNFIKAEQAAGRARVTLVLKNLSVTDAWPIFASDEAAANRPELVVTATPAANPQGMVVSASNLTVPEGASASFTVRLAAQPASDVVVNVAGPASGDPDLTTATTTLTFTPANWDVAQPVTVAAAQDADATDGAASFTLSSDGLSSKVVTATEADDDRVTLSAADDAYVRDGASAGLNFGAAASLMVKRSSTLGNSRETYLRFDLSGVTTITTAKLRLWGLLTNTDGTSVQVAAYGTTDTGWTETGVTYNDRPPAQGAALATVTVSGTAGTWYEWDVAAYLNAEKAAGRNLVTLALLAPNIGNPVATFNSAEATTNKPVLQIT